MKCPTCDHDSAEIKATRIDTQIKGESINVIVDQIVCAECGFIGMDDALMNNARRKSADTYREKHGLLTSDDIIQRRKKLGMNQEQFAEYLHVGLASIKRWETTFVQEPAHDEHIRIKTSYEDAEKNVFDLKVRSNPDEFTGNRSFNYESFANLTLYLTETFKSPLYINKGLFYADFIHYKKYKKSITGSEYVKLQYGPCPNNFQLLFEKMLADGKMEKSTKHDCLAKVKVVHEAFDDLEWESILIVVNLAQTKGKKRVFDLSHEEKAFKDVPFFSRISYKYAEKLLI
jgi:putative zinc finger/helix-turn-helix YgiT family protein